MLKEIVSQSEFKNITTFEAPVDDKSLLLAEDLRDTLRYNWSQGRISKSISSNQIGYFQRAIALSQSMGGKIEVMFNPKITLMRGEQEFWEDDLLVPYKMFKVKRYEEICVHFLNEKGAERSYHCYGEKAALVQQEIDNLNGILPSERAILDVDVELKRPNPKYLEEFGR